ncbi:substrate-binding domain-containing protein [Alteribacillus sp. HJP-4]
MIAEQLGISTATVDRVFNNRNGVSPKMAHKVKEKAKELNYKPNKSASFLSRKKEIRAAFLFPIFPEYFWKEIERGIWTAHEDMYHYGMDIEIIRKDHEVEEQIKTVEDIIVSDKYDALVFAPVDAEPFLNVIQKGINQGFPIYTFNNDSPLSKRLSYVGADYLDAGRLAGELLHQFMGPSKNFTLILDELNTFQMKQKIKGFQEWAAYNGVTFETPLYIEHRRLNRNLNESIALLEQDIEGLDGIYVACGALADVAGGIERMNLKNRPIIVGHDISKDINHYLQKGVVTATICQDPVFQGRQAVQTVFNHLMLEEEIDQVEQIVKLEIVTKGNAKYYI